MDLGLCRPGPARKQEQTSEARPEGLERRPVLGGKKASGRAVMQEGREEPGMRRLRPEVGQRAALGPQASPTLSFHNTEVGTGEGGREVPRNGLSGPFAITTKHGHSSCEGPELAPPTPASLVGAPDCTKEPSPYPAFLFFLMCVHLLIAGNTAH